MCFKRPGYSFASAAKLNTARCEDYFAIKQAKGRNTCSFSHTVQSNDPTDTRAACGGHKRRVKDFAEALWKKGDVNETITWRRSRNFHA